MVDRLLLRCSRLLLGYASWLLCGFWGILGSCEDALASY